MNHKSDKTGTWLKRKISARSTSDVSLGVVGRGRDVTEASESGPCLGPWHRETKSGTDVQTVPKWSLYGGLKRVGTATWSLLRLHHCVPKTEK